jgi:hypothetical protein
MMLRICIFTLISLFIILFITNRCNQENFNNGTTTASDLSTTSASDSSTTSVSDSSTTSVSDSSTTSAGDLSTTSVNDSNDDIFGNNEENNNSNVNNNTNSLIGNNVDDSMKMGTNYNNYFQGGFCKYQEKLGYQVGCSEHIYDDAFFNIDRELNSVKQNYSILKS